eukprot:scaffold199416_cov71-Attheya_sp.AAC.1
MRSMVTTEKPHTSYGTANQEFKDEITEVVEDFLKKKYKRMRRQRIGKLLACSFFSLCGGVAKEEILTLAKKELRRTTFAPWKILHAMDLNGDTLDYAGVACRMLYAAGI